MNGKIYIVIRLTNESERRRRDFSLAVDSEAAGIYSTRKNAEKAIAKCVRDFEKGSGFAPRLLGFYVQEFKVNRMLGEDSMWNSVCEREWTYTKDGKPFSYSPFSSDWRDGAYKGTPPDAIKFKPGDYAWAHMGRKFVPAKVLNPPYTPEEWKKKFGFASDASDDCYLVVMADRHEHPQTCSLFPIDGKIPGRIISAIEDRERKYLNGESL